jgi:hypothetical protein
MRIQTHFDCCDARLCCADRKWHTGSDGNETEDALSATQGGLQRRYDRSSVLLPPCLWKNLRNIQRSAWTVSDERTVISFDKGRAGAVSTC